MTQMSINDFFRDGNRKRTQANRSHSPMQFSDREFLLKDELDPRETTTERTLSMRSFSMKRHHLQNSLVPYSLSNNKSNRSNTEPDVQKTLFSSTQLECELE